MGLGMTLRGSHQPFGAGDDPIGMVMTQWDGERSYGIGTVLCIWGLSYGAGVDPMGQGTTLWGRG